MLVSVNNQAYIFLCIVFGGMLIGLIYDLFRVSRKAIKTNNIIVHLEDILFWLLVSILIFGVLFVFNAGMIRGYALLAIVLGVILYELLFSHYIVKFLLKLIEFINKAFKFLIKILSVPIKILIRIFAVPTRYIIKVFKRVKQTIKKVKNTLTHKIRLNIKNLKNSIKKY